MGSGKSFWGQLLAKDLKCAFWDLDTRIETETQQSIPELFESIGEAGFRQLEHDQLLLTAHLSPSVIALGGGTPCFYNHAAWLKDHGTVIFLNAPVHDIINRILEDGPDRRPILSSIQSAELELVVQNMLDKRMFWYAQAHYILVPPTTLDPVFLSRLKECINP